MMKSDHLQRSGLRIRSYCNAAADSGRMRGVGLFGIEGSVWDEV